ncbi:hypothetical protein CROQUDRAFT_348036 [Cronartium quercuum f. sp. fusiforme G11]|uniref:Uncharacterized protein n=1 Tax=Cronartium quercuum f. sp. fusiforme G11 TaxID=708437 RepID=A0A9P6NA46_9BASI|nr:hypothetical protein CROQUDRAFT_348036 [Cronartium quercuum f. sp. fusiforme G11]
MASINFHDQHFPISIFFFNLFRKPSKQNSKPAQKDHTKVTRLCHISSIVLTLSN